MGMSRIEQLIEDIYEFVESCKMQPLSQTRVIVPKDELYDLLDELKLRTPDEIKRYQKIIANRDAILADAEKKSLEIQENAQEKAKLLVNENEIMQQVYQQANEIMSEANTQAEMIIRSANEDAEQIRSGALAYSNEMLADVERVLHDAFESTKAKSESMINTLKNNLDTVVSNRRELFEHLNSSESNQDQMQEGSDINYKEDDYDFDSDVFLKDID